MNPLSRSNQIAGGKGSLNSPGNYHCFSVIGSGIYCGPGVLKTLYTLLIVAPTTFYFPKRTAFERGTTTRENTAVCSPRCLFFPDLTNLTTKQTNQG